MRLTIHQGATIIHRGWCLGVLLLAAGCSPASAPSQSGPVETKPATTQPATTQAESTTSESPKSRTNAAYDGSTAPPTQLVVPIVDPACLDTIAWISEPEARDVALGGCRDASLIPAADDDGWRTFESPDGHSIKTRGEAIDPATGQFSVEVIYRSGGTFSGRYKVSGSPDAQNVLKMGQFKVVPLN
jgi:hypothetical protein